MSGGSVAAVSSNGTYSFTKPNRESITLLAGLGHAFFGNVDWRLLASLAIGSLPGIFVGSHLTARIPEKLLRVSLVAVLLFAGTKLLMG